MFALIKWSLLRGSSRGSNGLSSLLNSVDMHNACTLLNKMLKSMMNNLITVWINVEQCKTTLHCLNQLRSIDCLNQCLRARPIQWTKLCSPAAAYGWWLPQLMPIHFERGWFPYDAQEWENLEMRGWGRCLRKTKLHFVRKDKFIDIDFGEHKRLSWDLYWVLCPEEFYYWLIKVVRKQSGELI